MKMRSNSGTHMVDVLFTLALFCVFAASALMVVLIGANVYKNTVRQMDMSFSGRTSLTYVATKIRQNDSSGGIHIDQIDGVTALVLAQEVDGEVYETWIYHYDGSLREIFIHESGEIEPENGQAILAVPEFRFERDGNMLRITTVDSEGNTFTQALTPRCGLV